MPFLKREEMLKNFVSKEEGHFIYFRFIDGYDPIVCLKPPEGFSDYLLVVSPYHQSTMKFYRKYPFLQEFEIKPDINLNQKTYLGFVEQKGKYRSFIFDPKTIKEEPVITEKQKGENKYFFNIDGSYYLAEGSLLKAVIKKDHNLINKLKSQIGHKINPYKIPIGLYEDALPVYYFHNELNYSGNINEGVIVKNSPYKTINMLNFAYPHKKERFDAILDVNDEELFGEKLPEISIGDEIEIKNPQGKKKQVLKNKIGKVVNIKKEMIEIKFLDYFVEEFKIKEIT